MGKAIEILERYKKLKGIVESGGETVDDEGTRVVEPEIIEDGEDTSIEESKQEKISKILTSSVASELTSNSSKILNMILKIDGQATFDADKDEGQFKVKGLTVNFNVGNENLHLTLPEVYSKDGHQELLDSAVKFMSAASNFGGASKLNI